MVDSALNFVMDEIVLNPKTWVSLGVGLAVGLATGGLGWIAAAAIGGVAGYATSEFYDFAIESGFDVDHFFETRGAENFGEYLGGATVNGTIAAGGAIVTAGATSYLLNNTAIGREILGMLDDLNQMVASGVQSVKNFVAELMDQIDDFYDDIISKLTMAKAVFEGYYQDANGRWHRPNGQFASNAEIGLDLSSSKTVSGGKVHGNSLGYEGTNYGYRLVHKETGEVLKYGESINPNKRYTQSYLDSIDAEMEILTSGSKVDIHNWQHDMILEYTEVHLQRPRLNLSNW